VRCEPSPTPWTRWRALAERPRKSARLRLRPLQGASAEQCNPGPSSAPSPRVEVADHLRVTGSVVARQAADRIYIVVANPRDPDRVGIFVGKWRTLEGALPGGRLYDSAARLRRVESVDEARAVWARAHPDIPMPTFRL